MSQSRLEWKVGLFVLVCLVLLGTLVIEFSKGWTLFKSTYELRLRTTNVGGIKAGAVVLMAGVPVGNVARAELNPDGRSVVVFIEVLSRYPVHRDARFVIEQAGFLGDQYISILPRAIQVPELLKPGEEVACEEPFNLQEVARSAAGLIKRVDETAAKLNEAVSRIDTTFLSEQTLTNLAITVTNFRRLSDRSLATLDGVDALLLTNTPGVNATVSNLTAFSAEIQRVTGQLQQVVATNREAIDRAVKNVESATQRADNMLQALQAGKGLAGSLLNNEQLKADLSLMASNFTVLSSNLNKFGLLYKPRLPKHRSTVIRRPTEPFPP
ncbi:MAG: MCE family protein [Verrucomicrobia bacterium]|nr:MCE family protein [Verrucomicrobiota bacterium]